MERDWERTRRVKEGVEKEGRQGKVGGNGERGENNGEEGILISWKMVLVQGCW